MTEKLKVNDLDLDAEDVLDRDSIIALESLDACHASVILDACEWLWKSRELDGEYAVTYETLENFEISRKRHWSKKGQPNYLVVDGRQAIFYQDMQPAKGERRRSLLVIDLDGICLAITKW